VCGAMTALQPPQCARTHAPTYSQLPSTSAAQSQQLLPLPPSLLLPRRPHATVACQRDGSAASPSLSSGQQRSHRRSGRLVSIPAHLHAMHTHCTTCGPTPTVQSNTALTTSMGRFPPRLRTSARAPASSSTRAQSTRPCMHA